MQCSRCSKTIPETSVECPSCGAPVEASPSPATGTSAAGSDSTPDDAVTSLWAHSGPSGEAPTSVEPGESTPGLSGSDSGQHGRFLPGTTVAGRYRIVGLLGRGGMGEVYRADDLKLDQQVALKFLPPHMVADDDHVRRLFDEVRMARKVSHPNVCRVWDVGETDGQHYVSMEYVDGEDLGSLLRRIGRLPEDKAVEIARQLGAALAAAHDEGVLHRDLKPANIMLDGRGRVKLTDFGLAAVAEVRAGTPIYMAPEQLAGTEVSVRSDIYSLGIVLHELFTGKRVFEADSFDELSRLHDSAMTTSFTSTSQLDPSIDRVIHRCLEKDPDKRPQSALAVAAGLPGADPLAAALAAGETPSPEMVAEAGGEGRLSVAVALPLLFFVIAGALAVGLLQSGRSLVGWVPFDMSPAQLDLRALDVLEELGHPTDYVDTASQYDVDRRYLAWVRREGATDERLATIGSGRAASIVYWWRGSPRALVPNGSTGAGLSAGASLADPPRTRPGMVSLQLDSQGRLLWLDAIPDRLSEDDAAITGATDWQRVFELMDLDMSAFRPVPPRLSPDHFADERAAWEGPFPEDPNATMRIEVASHRGRATSLRVFTPARPLEPAATTGSSPVSGFATATTVAIILIVLLMVLTVIFGGFYVAQRNIRSGRGDGRGARRLGLAIAVAIGTAWLFSEHTFTPADINALIEMLIFVSASGSLTWALYLAVEPFMRRQSPEALIGWTRFIDGRWADPLVGRDLLIGTGAGVLSRLLVTIPQALAERPDTIENNIALPHSSILALLRSLTSDATGAVLLGLGMSFLYGLSFLMFGRRPWVAYAAWLFFLGGMGFLPGLTINGGRPAITLLSSVFWVLVWALWLYVLFRLGLLVFLAMSTTSALLTSTLPTLDFTAWYASSMVAGLTILFGVAGYAFYRCVEWKGGLAEALGGD